MRALALSLPRRIGLSWLVCAALLLPFSQAFAAWHGLSHENRAAAGTSDDSGPPLHKAACEICLAAAAVGHGGMAAAATSVPAPDVLATSVAQAPMACAACTPIVAYLSRAPPARLR
jgi:hypothetical protein